MPAKCWGPQGYGKCNRKYTAAARGREAENSRFESETRAGRPAVL